ncbi:MAG: hypothetical protein QXP29_07125 [Candidatus Nezhaarchaeales archaeon]
MSDGSSYVYKLERDGRELIVTGFTRDGRVRVSLRIRNEVFFMDENDVLGLIQSLANALIRARRDAYMARSRRNVVAKSSHQQKGEKSFKITGSGQVLSSSKNEVV